MVFLAVVVLISCEYTIFSSADEGGEISPSGAVVVSQGQSRTFTVKPHSGYDISNIVVDGQDKGAVASYTFRNVASDHAIHASFSATFPQNYTITASAGTGGSISPSGSVTVAEGDDKTFTITSDSGYSISSVVVDGVAQGAISSYTFANVTSDHTISASFSGIDTTGPTGSISINSGATFTTNTSVMLSISASDPSGVDMMHIRNSGTGWLSYSYSTSASWTLTSGDELKTVYIEFMDNLGNVSSTYVDSIFLDMYSEITVIFDKIYVFDDGDTVGNGVLVVRRNYIWGQV